MLVASEKLILHPVLFGAAYYAKLARLKEHGSRSL
jgi:hypothetical protein